MQIKSSCESMCVDYYEIKDINGNLDTQNRLKVLTFMGETMKKGVINVLKMAEELDDYLQNYNYKVTLTEGQIGVILCSLEKSVKYADSEYVAEVDTIFEELEGGVDKYYDIIEKAKSNQPTPDW